MVESGTHLDGYAHRDTCVPVSPVDAVPTGVLIDVGTRLARIPGALEDMQLFAKNVVAEAVGAFGVQK